MHKPLLSPIRYFVVRSVRRLVGELTVSTLATLIVTATLSNLFFASRPVPSATTAHPTADAILFSPQPIGPGNNGLEPVTLTAEPTLPAKAARDQAGLRKLPRPQVRIVEPAALAPAGPAIQPPLQLTGANIAAATPMIDAGEKHPAEHFRPAALVFRPIHAIADQLGWLLPKF